MEWIKVDSRLPTNDDDVLVYNPKDGISHGFYDENDVSSYVEDDGSKFFSNTGWTSYYDWAPYMSPTHWMPFPDQPKD